MAGWYDGCVGLQPSAERMNSANFSISFTPNQKGALHYLTENFPQNPRNLTNMRIGKYTIILYIKRCL